MYCQKCGKQISDTAKYCPYCGASVGVEGRIFDAASEVFDSTEKDIGNAINDVKVSIDNKGEYVPGNRLSSDRGFLATILLSIITCGIYYYYFVYKLAQDINVACKDDGDNTPGMVAYILLSFVTCGIYTWWWEYKVANRLAANAPRYGLEFQENGTTILLWNLFGALICGIGPYISLSILIKNTNAICNGYNIEHGF